MLPLMALSVPSTEQLLAAAQGAFNGAIAGDAPEGAVIGAIAGSVIGVVMGAYEPFNKQRQTVQQCLRGKGYVVGTL